MLRLYVGRSGVLNAKMQTLRKPYSSRFNTSYFYIYLERHLTTISPSRTHFYPCLPSITAPSSRTPYYTVVATIIRLRQLILPGTMITIVALRRSGLLV